MKLRVVERSRLWWGLSLALILIGLAAAGICFAQTGAPLKLGLDFTGGTRLQLELDCSGGSGAAGETSATGEAGGDDRCERPINLEQVRSVLVAQDLTNSSPQLLDRDPAQNDRHVLAIRSKDLSVNQRTALVSALEAELGRFNSSATQIDTVGPVLGQQILSSGLLAIVLALLGIVGFLSLRFQLDYAIFAIVALVHDVAIVVGAFALLGLLGGVEVDTLFVVALLTIIGFSVNDTVVIYDRVRENLQQHPERSINATVDAAVAQTLGRSINTTVSTLLAVVAIFLFGGSTLRFFSLALIIGFIAGSYSSIFVASTLLAWWRSRPGYQPPTPPPPPEPRESLAE